MQRCLLPLLVAALAAAPLAQAQEETVSASVGRFGEFVDESTVQVPVTVTCTAGANILESFVYIVQRESTSRFAFFNPACDGTAHTYVVTVRTEEGMAFRRGPARVSGYVLLTSGASTSPTGKIIIR